MGLQREKPVKLKANYTKSLELTSVDFPASHSDPEEQGSAWNWRQHDVIKIEREWESELQVWDHLFLPVNLVVTEENSLALSSVPCFLSLKGALKHGLFLRGGFCFNAFLWKDAHRY